MPRAAISPQKREDGSSPHLLSLARRMIVARRALEGPLPPAILQDTPLDILLRLFVAGDEPVAPTVLHAGMGASESVVERWLAALAQEDLIARDDDGYRLTDTGHAAMIRALDAVTQSQIDPHDTPVHR